MSGKYYKVVTEGHIGYTLNKIYGPSFIGTSMWGVKDIEVITDDDGANRSVRERNGDVHEFLGEFKLALKISSVEEREMAVKAIDEFDKRSQKFEVGGKYSWSNSSVVWECVYVGENEAACKNIDNSLEIFGLWNLKNGYLVRVD